MLMFLIISNAGFPWRMASTGALFALMLAILGASDARLGYRWRDSLHPHPLEAGPFAGRCGGHDGLPGAGGLHRATGGGE
jgi:hypothetical protein